MDKQTIETTFFRGIPVQSKNLDCGIGVFRPIPVQSAGDRDIFPLHTRSSELVVAGCKRPLFPVQTRSHDMDGRRACVIFLGEAVCRNRESCYLCTVNNPQNSTSMAGTTKEMNLIKQVIQLKMLGESNRGIARKLNDINKGTVNGYMNTIKANGWSLEWLLAKEDPELERMFHAGSPAYTDGRNAESVFGCFKKYFAMSEKCCNFAPKI